MGWGIRGGKRLAPPLDIPIQSDTDGYFHVGALRAGTYRVGFAHTQTGALLATYHYFVHANPSTAGAETRAIAEYGLVDGPLKDQILKRIDDVLNGVEPRHTDADMAKISLRGYEAGLILKHAGFKNVRVLDGGIAMWPYEKVQ